MQRHDTRFTVRHLSLTLALAVACCALATPAHAQYGAAQTPQTSTGWSMGIRGGVAANPTQVVVGVHFESPGLTSTGHITFRPNVEIGFRGGETLLEGNLDICYWAALPKSDWSLFFGAGPSAVFAHVSNQGGNHVGGGAQAVVGLERRGLSLEMRAGGGSSHSLEAIVGYTIKKGS